MMYELNEWDTVETATQTSISRTIACNHPLAEEASQVNSRMLCNRRHAYVFLQNKES